MSVDPKQQNAELLKLIGANKERIAHTHKVLREMHKRTNSKVAGMDKTELNGKKLRGLRIA